jgi:hypothetical protein
MIMVELLVVLLFIYLGARIVDIGIGFAGGAGVVALTMVLGVPAGSIPVDVILIIASVITAIAAMQVAGGMDWLVDLAEQFLRKKPKHITFYAPVVTYLMTLLAGTGHTAFSTLPVLAEVAKEQGVLLARFRLRSWLLKSPSRLHLFLLQWCSFQVFLNHSGWAISLCSRFVSQPLSLPAWWVHSFLIS